MQQPVIASQPVPADRMPRLRLDCVRPVNLIVVHCTASRCDHRLTPDELEREHLQRGFNGCGYHFYITGEGIIHPMRPLDRIGAHARGFNARSVGIAYEGGLLPPPIPAHRNSGSRSVFSFDNCSAYTRPVPFAAIVTSAPTLTATE